MVLCSRVVTSSFDKSVRIWSMDGKLVHRLDGFSSTVTGICYVPRNKVVWAAGGTSYATLYDSRSGENVRLSWHLKRKLSFSFYRKIVLHTKLLAAQICFNGANTTLHFNTSVFSNMPYISVSSQNVSSI